METEPSKQSTDLLVSNGSAVSNSTNETPVNSPISQHTLKPANLSMSKPENPMPNPENDKIIPKICDASIMLSRPRIFLLNLI